MPTKTELIYPTEFYYNHVIAKNIIPQEELSEIEVPAGSPCFVCGRKDFTRGVAKKDAIKPLFTDFGSCKGTSDYVCIYCASTITNHVRRTGWYCVASTEVRTKKDVSIGDIIRNPPEPPFLIGLGDGQKHTVLRGKVSLSKELFFFYDSNRNANVEVCREEVMALSQILERLAKALKSTPTAVAYHKFGKTKLETLSDEDRAMYNGIGGKYSIASDTTYAALKVLQKKKKTKKIEAGEDN